MIQSINHKRNKKGFTLVELVVVIAILGILAAIAVPKFSQSSTNAAITAHNVNVRTLESAAILAVSEGANTIETWGGKDKAKETGDYGWGNYLQDWPTLPKGLSDQKAMTVTREDEKEDEINKESILSGDEFYEVDIKNGSVTVFPGRISDDTDNES